MEYDSIKIVVAIVAAGISLAGMCVTIFVADKSRKATRNSLKLQHFNATQASRIAVREWGNEVLAVLSEAMILCELDPAKADNFFDRRNILRARLSELADRGRWFFENDRTSGFDESKRRANQGFAPHVIDMLKEALELHVQKLNYIERADNQSHRQSIVDIKKDIVDKLQEFLSPEQAHRDLEDILLSIK